MADSLKKKDDGVQGGGDAWDAIAAFEQILDVIPNDHVALDALAHAYEMVGDHSKACEYLVRLATLMIEQDDIESASSLLEKLKPYAKSNPDAAAVVTRIEKSTLDREPQSPPVQSQVPQPVSANPERQSLQPPVNREKFEAVKRTSNVADELSFAWHLLQSSIITQDEYSTVAQDLTEISAGEANVTVSVLHVLQDRGLRNLESVIAFSARDSSTPVVSLSIFDLQKETVSLMPLDFIIQRGALPFEVLGSTVLIVLLNPYNKKLRDDIQMLLGKKCHFFITLPSEFDNAVGKIKGMNEGDTEKKK